MIPENFITVPTFSSIENIDEAVPKMYLNSAGVLALKRILWALHKTYDRLIYCPLLPSLISIILIYLNEEEAFELCDKLIEHSENVHLINKKEDFNQFIGEIVIITVREVPKLLGQERILRKVIADMIRKLFLGYFRIPCVLKIAMIYLFEGKKVLAKIVAALFSMMECGSKGQIRLESISLLEVTKSYTFSLPSCDDILQQAFCIKFLEVEEEMRSFG